jgi:glutaredoxin
MSSLIAIGIGGLIAMIGLILLLIASFRQHIGWGLAVLFAPLGSIVYTCVHWAEAKIGFLAHSIGSIVCLAGFFTIPMVQDKIMHLKLPGRTAQMATPAPDFNAQIQQHRDHLEALQGAFAQDGADLTRQYQALEAQRKALKPANTAAITKFNEAAAAYQARNVKRKEMQQEMDTTQKELDDLLAARSRAATAAVAGKPKVIMYTTSHCPACKAAKQYLAQKGVPYQEIDVESSRDGAAAFQKLGGHGVPLILVGDKKMEGFSPQALDALL